MRRDPDDLSHVLRMVLNDNTGQRITEALIIGIDESVHYYLGEIENSTKGMSVPYEIEKDADNGTPTQFNS